MDKKTLACNKSSWTLKNKKPAFFIENYGLYWILLNIKEHQNGAESRNRTGTPCSAGF